MFRNTVLLLLASCAITSTALWGSAVDTCVVQKNLISITISPVTAGVNGVVDCPGECPQYRVCLELVGLEPGKSISHTCVKPPNQCPLLGFDSYKSNWGPGTGFGLAESGPPVNMGYKQCQIGSSGEVIYFLLKDGNGCLQTGSPDFASITNIPIANTSLTTTAECRSRTGWGNANLVINSCTGNKPAKECVWAVKIPQGSCGVEPVVPYDKDCDQCAPVNQECRNEINLQPSNSIAYDITDCKDPLGLKEDLKAYGCELSKVPNCNVIYCASFVPLDAFVTDTITYDVMQCPLR